MNQFHTQYKVNNLSEGLRRSDLKDVIDTLFNIDQYQSKMGDDKNTIVLSFRAKDKEPAIDLMEFIEKGFSFVLDADISSGEERDGKYSIFVELERTENAPSQVKELLNGLSQLCDCNNWRFRWYKDIAGHDFDKEIFTKTVPLTPDEYELRIKGTSEDEITEFFDQSALESIQLDFDKNISFKKSFLEPITAKLIAIGEYNILKNVLHGGLQLDESSRCQVSFLNKFLGNYDINKIENHFLIRNGNKAIILAKNNW